MAVLVSHHAMGNENEQNKLSKVISPEFKRERLP